jgi:hypothetical protein
MKQNIVTTAWWDELRRGINSLNDLKENELAYLCLTSKPEHVIRDRVALYLEGNTDNGVKAVSREWTSSHGIGRTDLAVVDISNEENTPELAVEFKVYGFLEELDRIKPRHEREMLSDIKKLQKLINGRKGIDGQQPMCYFVLIHQTLRDIVPSNLLGVVKYAKLSNERLKNAKLPLRDMQNECNARARYFLECAGVFFGNGEWVRIDAGEHWGIGVDLDVLIGQVTVA